MTCDSQLKMEPGIWLTDLESLWVSGIRSILCTIFCTAWNTLSKGLDQYFKTRTYVERTRVKIVSTNASPPFWQSILPNGTLPPVATCNIYEPSSEPSPRRLNKVNRARTYLRHLPMKVCKLRPNPTLRGTFYCHSAACKPNCELYVIT